VNKAKFLEKASSISKNIRERLALEGLSGRFVPKDNSDKGMVFKPSFEVRENHYFEYMREFNNPNVGYLVFNGDLIINRDVNNKWISRVGKKYAEGKECLGVVVIGDLYVIGDVVGDKGIGIFVLGDLKCKYLFSGDGCIEVRGGIDAEFGIQGYGNNGVLKVDGSVRTPYIIGGDHTMPRESLTDFIYIESSYAAEFEYIAIGKECGNYCGWGWNYWSKGGCLLRRDVLDEDKCFDPDAFFDKVRRGDNPFIEPEDWATGGKGSAGKSDEKGLTSQGVMIREAGERVGDKVTGAVTAERSLSFDQGNSHKFWRAFVKGCELVVCFGKIGTNGQSIVKTFESSGRALREMEKLVNEKLRKGYIDNPL